MADLLLLVDFDGTVYRGAAPARAYAARIAASLTAARRAGYLAAMDRFLRGDGGVEAADGW
ncbi:MAG: enhanced intracellular survival protein Eis, partial [Actinocrinis sp.]